MAIKFTKKQTNNSILLTTNCSIQNWDPQKNNTAKKPIFNFNAYSNDTLSGIGNVQENLLQALAGGHECCTCDDPDNSLKLTELDLKEAANRINDKNNKNNKTLGGIQIKEFRYDEHYGIANITTVNGDVLRVDLLTVAEIKNGEDSSKGIFQAIKSAVTKTFTKSTDQTNVQNKKHTQKIEHKAAAQSASKEHKTEAKKRISIKSNVKSGKAATTRIKKQKVIQVRNKNISKIISKFKGGKIDINKVHDMASVAKYTGISERYIKNILVGIEGKNNWPLTTAEYDGVKDKKHPKGYLTIGFGHTGLAGEPTVYEGMAITSKQAYQILANDIITSVKYAKYYGGKAYEKAPTSIKNAMIDLVFNKGPGAINENLKANLNKGYFHSAALRTWYNTSTLGLHKRNMYRFIEACKNLNFKERKSAISRFKKERFKELNNVFRKDIKAKTDWNTLCTASKCKEYSV